MKPGFRGLSDAEAEKRSVLSARRRVGSPSAVNVLTGIASRLKGRCRGRRGSPGTTVSTARKHLVGVDRSCYEHY